MNLKTSMLAPLLISVPVAASAQAPAARDAYVGVGLGAMSFEIRADGEAFFDSTSRALDLYGGFRISRNWNFEFSYQITDSAVERGLPANVGEHLGVPGFASPLPATTAARLEIATLRGLRHFRRSWGAWYLGIGISGAAVDTTVEIAGADPLAASIHISKNGLTAAAGAEWTWSSVVLRVEYEWWDADMSGVGLSLHRRL